MNKTFLQMAKEASQAARDGIVASLHPIGSRHFPVSFSCGAG